MILSTMVLQKDGILIDQTGTPQEQKTPTLYQHLDISLVTAKEAEILQSAQIFLLLHHHDRARLSTEGQVPCKSPLRKGYGIPQRHGQR